MRLVENWRWRYSDPNTGSTGHAAQQVTAEESALRDPDAQRIEDRMTRREVNPPPFEDTSPGVLHVGSM